MDNFSGFILVVLLILGLVIFGPLVLLWAVNLLLFESGVTTQIPYSFDTWFATALIMGCLRGGKG